MSQKGIYRYTVGQRDVDYTGKCAHTSLMNHILQAAGDDADLNGFGIKDLNVGNCSWVLSRVCCEFLRRPDQGETIHVRTWVNDVGRLMTTRNMEVLDGESNPIAYTVTQWAVIDIDTRHAVDIRSKVDYRGKVTDEKSPTEPPVRIPRIDADPFEKKKVLYSDIDFNRHMNAMKYVEWVIDHTPVEMVTGSLKRIDINFIREAVLEQRIELLVDPREEVYRYEIRAAGSGEPLCRCALLFA